MDIGQISPRKADSSRCPYCHDDVVQGPACKACGARYHVECAQTFGACAVQGCVGELVVPNAAPEVLPRLAALARRIGRWSLPSGGPRALILDLPASKAVRDDPGPAARVIAELLGQSPYDGRMRVLSPFPEPLVRLRSEAEAARVQERLGRLGVPCIAPTIEELVRPFDSFEPAQIRMDSERVDLESATGEQRSLWNAEPRLLITSGIVTTTQVTGRILKSVPRSGRGGRGAVRASRAPAPQKVRERCAYLFERGNPQPVLFRASVLTKGSLRSGSASPVGIDGNFHGLLEALLEPGGTRRNFPEVMCSNQLFMHPVDEGGRRRSNAAFVALLARVSYMCWIASQPEAAKSK